ncbi:MAG: DinB family protein [Candidatus Rokubacteria bacterium]|nr:DinB family protein [Candidatus Rokubacteria bacterium]
MTDASGALDPREAAALLRAGAAAARAEVAALPPAALAWHPAPDEWCVKEVLGHLIEAEQRGFAGRIRQILASDEPALAAWDPVAVARARRDCERDAAALLAEFETLRTASVALVAGLREADLARGGTTRRRATCASRICSTSGSTTTATISSRCWPTCRPSSGRTWATPSASPRAERGAMRIAFPEGAEVVETPAELDRLRTLGTLVSG